MNKVLLTGCNGFTGKYVEKELLAHGYEVIGLVYKNAKNNQIACDLTDKAALIDCLAKVKPDYIIHLAALSFVGHKEPRDFYSVNVFGTINILEAAQEAKLSLKKVILASSANIYGSPGGISVIAEDSIPMPVNHYAMSKLAMEHMAKLWFDKFHIIITRPFNYTGPNQEAHFLVPKIVSHFKQGSAGIELGNLDVSRDFSDVRYVAKVYVDLLGSDARSEMVNICSGEGTALKDLISTMEDIAGYEIEVTVNPDFVRKDEIKVLIGSDKRLKSMISLPEKIAIKQTLLDMYRQTSDS
jgi:nucleoside-diphosphate-sugar epimerase